MELDDYVGMLEADPREPDNWDGHIDNFTHDSVTKMMDAMWAEIEELRELVKVLREHQS